jgi:hypothetical protein
MAEQELRRELLFFSLSKWPELETAIEMAALMERFVLEGSEDSRRDEIDAVATKIDGEGNPGDRPAAGRAAAASASAPLKAESRSAGPGTAAGQKRRWSAADDDNLRRLWHSSQPLEDIAAELGRSTPSLYCRARDLGLSRRNAKSSTATGSASSGHDPLAAVQATAADLKPCRAQHRNGSKRPAPERNGSDRGRAPSRPLRAVAHSAVQEQADSGIDPIIHFLRSRDYSVIRAEEGRYRLDGRRVLSATELREKANQVRQALGQPPFATQPAEPVG